MKFDNVYFINGTAYAGKSTMVKLLAEKYNGIACEENYHDQLSTDLDSQEIYHKFLNYGFNVIIRDEERTVDETLSLVEDVFKLNIY